MEHGRTDDMLGSKTRVSKFKKTAITQNMFSIHNKIKLKSIREENWEIPKCLESQPELLSNPEFLLFFYG
jgi:hypothetical protein